jgi:DNA-binding MarR family transcriptional regulator
MVLTQPITVESLIAQETARYSLTSNEIKVLTAFIQGLYAEPGFSDIDANDLSRETGITTRSIRGILASLVKKGYLQIEPQDTGYVIIYLMESKYYLHPSWRNNNPWYYTNPADEGKTYAELYS